MALSNHFSTNSFPNPDHNLPLRPLRAQPLKRRPDLLFFEPPFPVYYNLFQSSLLNPPSNLARQRPARRQPQDIPAARRPTKPYGAKLEEEEGRNALRRPADDAEEAARGCKVRGAVCEKRSTIDAVDDAVEGSSAEREESRKMSRKIRMLSVVYDLEC